MKASLILGILVSQLSLVKGECLPQVDLGYEIHEALKYNETTDLYTFSNIRYAQPPVGDLRFSAPKPPTGRNHVVQKGNGSIIMCPQGSPGWGSANADFGHAFINGNLSDYNYTEEHAAQELTTKKNAQTVLELPQTEDCLFLDVVVSRAVFERRNSKAKKAPVLVWMHGGGYIFGYKNDVVDATDPAGLINASRSDGSDGFIYVSLNYRLGAFGWLAGPSLEAANGTANAGLHDQHLALQWVQKYIHLFGGDPKKVTLSGLSAGGGSTVHHITAYGGKKGPAPFARAFINSPGYFPIASNFQAENITQYFLKFLNASTIEEARKLPARALMEANVAHTSSVETNFVYGPAVDGDFVPALPGLSLLSGNFHKNIDLLLSHTRYEGGEYSQPFVQSDDDFKSLLHQLYPGIVDEMANYIIKDLYPGKGAVRTIDFMGDSVFACNTNWLARAFANQTYNMQFNISPPFHAYDESYIWKGYGRNNFGAPVIESLASSWQGYITNFIKTGNPNGRGLPPFPQQGQNASANILTPEGIITGRDSTAGHRCEWLQKGLFV
ncbi:carboxylesterase family domain-containing protein [Trichoderma breve]|uniref:Carboxylic ester hydrolase n=1 Tax=Trichoderma breve TaxID=2034170 RepID=A0A9W9BEE4_9HYPO|nr:carboxylesterase family domain-containing protein [Trichoderma breve]KAJ4861625.1 carboxylesterase family domain-containing protein [Trichoderma breve]